MMVLTVSLFGVTALPEASRISSYVIFLLTKRIVIRTLAGGNWKWMVDKDLELGF
jgi:hypothetical protein